MDAFYKSDTEEDGRDTTDTEEENLLSDGEYETPEVDVTKVNNNEIPVSFKEPKISPELIARLYINYPYLKELRNEDFNIKSRTLIDFKEMDEDGAAINKGAWFILFHDQSATSQKYLRAWIELARTIGNNSCYLGHCNLNFEEKIKNNFIKLGDKEYINHPFSWAKLVETPFLMVYRDSWPQGFYNGTMFLEELVDFCVEIVKNDNFEITKKFTRRKNIRDEVIARDKKLLRAITLEKAKEREEKEKEKEKEIDTRTQKIARGVDFTT